MSPNNLGLRKGDVVEIGYPAKHAVASTRFPPRRWFRARVVDCMPDAWPLVRLDDGQTTEIRGFMHWRLIARAQPAAPIQDHGSTTRIHSRRAVKCCSISATISAVRS
jgi:hypothetical protein